MWVTEVSFPASKGKLKPVGALGRETPRGMGRRLYNTYLLLARKRKRERLDRVYWYTWSSSYKREEPPSHFDYAGLLARSSAFSFKPQPALNSFRRIAERMEGCPKNERGALPLAREQRLEQRVDARRGLLPGEPGRAPPPAGNERVPLGAGRRCAEHGLGEARPRRRGRPGSAASPQVSGSAPRSEQTTGVPAAIASRQGRPKPS